MNYNKRRKKDYNRYYFWAEKFGPKSNLEIEIAKDEYYSYFYALNILEDRFPLGEPVIAKDAGYSYRYALNILEDRFPLGEPAIAKYNYYRNDYCKYFNITI